jgi:hypothetical protein
MTAKSLYLLSIVALLAASPALGQGASSEAAPAVSQPSAEAPDAASEDDEGEGTATEPSGPALPSADALKLFLTSCTEVASGVVTAHDDMEQAGWSADEAENTGPYVTVYSGYQELAGYGSVDLWSSVESFPSQRLGYCRVDLGDVDNLLDFNDVEKLGLIGTVTDQGNGNAYGSWESADHKTLLSASRADGQVQIELNVMLGTN